MNKNIRMNYSVKSFCFHPSMNLEAVLYQNPHCAAPKSCLLYFHGGGLLYGDKEDLPVSHLNILTGQGHAVFAFDYRLAPVTKLPEILNDVKSAIGWYIKYSSRLFGYTPPYFLWGRSAGAYLCLLSGLLHFTVPPAGIISYYGYGFVTDSWYALPTSYYLQFPQSEEDAIQKLIGDKAITCGTLQERYPLYLHARQTGKWPSYLYHGDRQTFVDCFTLTGSKRLCSYPKTLLAHSIYDPDVPYSEAQALSHIIPQNECFLSFANVHDFDRNSGSRETRQLLLQTLQFIEKNIPV